MAIVTEPFASVAAAALKAPLVSVTEPVGAGVPETATVAVTAVASSMMGEEKLTLTVGVAIATAAAGIATAQVFEGPLD
jgi:hypothetical protein